MKISRNVVVYVSLAGILLITLLLRLHGIDWGLPTALDPNYSYHPDEAILLRNAQWLAQGRILDKGFIYGGTFYYVILRACTYFGGLFHESIGGFNVLASSMLVARYLQVVIALVTVLLVYESGRVLYDRATGLISALIVALAPAHIIATQTVRPDAISAFLVTLVVFITAKLLKSDQERHAKLFFYSGIAVGALAAFRLPLIIFGLLPVLGYVASHHRPDGISFRKLISDRSFFWFASIVVLGYAVLSPHPLMYPHAFVAGLKLTARFEMAAFPDAVERGPVFFQYAWRLLHQALGYPAYVLAIGGVACALVYRRAESTILLVGTGLYFVMLAAVTWTVVRYTVPILPLLALLGAACAVKIRELANHTLSRTIVYSVAGLSFLWTLAADIALVDVVAAKNVRELSSEWITENVPRDKSLMVIKRYREDDFFNPSVPPYHSVSAGVLASGSDTRVLFSSRVFDYLVLHELLYSDMERLGDRHPIQEVREFQENLKNAKLEFVREFKMPYRFLGIDFSKSFEAIDFAVINPGIRIYRAPDPSS